MKAVRISLVIVTILVGLATLSSLASAQPGEGWGGRGADPNARLEQQIERMTEQLELTDGQKEELRPILEAQGEKMREIMQDSSIDREQKREQFMKLRKETEPKIKQILTEEQYEKWQKLRQQQRGGRGRRGPR
jgi:Spy/CpxP family protein refolding chaperone